MVEKPPDMTEPTPEQRTDEELMLALVVREEAAFGELFDRYSPLLHAISLRILRRPTDAEAVLSEVFYEIWQNAERFNPERGSARTYLKLLVRSRAIDRLRADRNRTTHEAALSTERESQLQQAQRAANPVQQAERNEDGELVAAALKQLNTAQQKALQLAFYEGLTHREIAEQLDTPLGTIKTHIRQGLIKLGHALRTKDHFGGE